MSSKQTDVNTILWKLANQTTQILHNLQNRSENDKENTNICSLGYHVDLKKRIPALFAVH